MNEVLLIIVTIVLSGFFSGSEIAFVTANRLKLEIKARKDSVAERWVSFFIKRPETFLSTTLIGNNIVNVLYATLMTLFLSRPLSDWHAASFGQAPGEVLLLLYQTIITSLVIMIFGEILPKAIFRTQPDFFVTLASIPLRISHVIFLPLIKISDYISKFIVRLFKGEVEETEQVYRRQDIELLMREIHNEGASDLDKDDSELLTNVLELNNTRVREVMIPRTEMVALAKGTSMDDVLEAFIKTGYSRLPVYEDNIDNIIGIVYAYDMFHSPKDLMTIIRPIRVVPSSQRAQSLLSNFRKDNDSMAIILDEYGGTAGLVTIEDLLEEVVGDIKDEYDTDDHFAKKLKDGSYVMSATMEIEEMLERFPELQKYGFDEDEDYETLAGFIIHHQGRIPSVNEELIVGSLKFIISKATPARIENVRMIPLMN